MKVANYDECALHCLKKDYSYDWKEGILRKFYEDLLDYISSYAFEDKKQNDFINEKAFKNYLNGVNPTPEIKRFGSGQRLFFRDIFFPERDSRDQFDYLKIFNFIDSVHFDDCKFSAGRLDIKNADVFFQDSHFYKSWSVSDSKILRSQHDVLYQNCTFYENVDAYGYDESFNNHVKISLFNDCKFEKNLSLANLSFQSPIFNNTPEYDLEIKQLNIDDCKFTERFTLNNHTFKKVSISNTEFSSKFEFKNNVVDEFILTNTNFMSIFDAYETTFHEFESFKNIYHDFVGFEKCDFGYEGNSNKDYIAKFKYATFLSFTNFRNTIFHSGLDIENINLKEPPNFLNINVDAKNTNRETLRIIKNSFDKIGNHIEANKFYVYEMRKYKEELTGKPITQEKVIFWFNEKTSRFGQSYLLPMGWLCITAILYHLVHLGYELDLLYKILPPANTAIRIISTYLNSVTSNIIPFVKILHEGMEFVSLIFYLIFASLIWLTILAIKRHTKR